MAYTNPAARLGFGTPNLINGAGYVRNRISLDYPLCLNLYCGSWIIKNVVDVIAEDVWKAFPTLLCQVTPKQISAFERVIAKTDTEGAVVKAYKWGRLFGGAIAVMSVDDGLPLHEPLDLDAIPLGAYKGLMVFDRWSGVTPSNQLIRSLNDPANYGLPEAYQCQTEDGRVFTVHHSRVLRFTGRDLPLLERQIQNHWGMSELEVVFEELTKRDYSSASIASLLSRAQVTILKEPSLAQALSGQNLSDQQLQDYILRIQTISEQMSSQSVVALGEGAELLSNSYSFAGVADVYTLFMLDVAGACQTPFSKLYGRSPTGLGQTGDNELQNYESMIAQKQKREARPQMNKLFPVIAMSTWGMVPDDLDFQFPSVRTLTEENKLDLAEKITKSVLDVKNAGLIGTVAVTLEAEVGCRRFRQAATEKMSKSLFTKRISSLTCGLHVRQCPRRIMRITSKPLIVAAAVFIVWKPRVGRSTRFSAP